MGLAHGDGTYGYVAPGGILFENIDRSEVSSCGESGEKASRPHVMGVNAKPQNISHQDSLIE